jgi:hypothetical protein
MNYLHPSHRRVTLHKHIAGGRNDASSITHSTQFKWRFSHHKSAISSPTQKNPSLLCHETLFTSSQFTFHIFYNCMRLSCANFLMIRAEFKWTNETDGIIEKNIDYVRGRRDVRCRELFKFISVWCNERVWLSMRNFF